MIKEWWRGLQARQKQMWRCMHNQAKIRKTKESGLETKVEVVTTTRMVEIINKKEVHQIINKVQMKLIIDVMVPIEVGEETSFTRVTSNVTIVKNISILQVNALETRKIKK